MHFLTMRQGKWLGMVLSVMITACCGFLSPLSAQTTIEYNAPMTIANGQTDEANYIFIGPDAVLTVEEDWYVMAQNIYIHPDAQILGPGTIHVMDPATFGNYPSGPTTLDGGGAVVGAILSVENSNNLVLNNIDPAAVAPGIGWTDPGTAGSDDLVMGNTLNLGADGGDVLLNAGNLVFEDAATISYTDLNDIDYPGVDPEPAPPAGPGGAILVTNGTGHVVKQFAAAGSFQFPVGIQEGDYTPAILDVPAAGEFFVQVADYSSSASEEEAAQEGIDRSWHIYSDQAVAVTLHLQHNTSTNGAAYVDAQGFITQYQSGVKWSSAAPGGASTGDMPGSSVVTQSYTVPASAADNTGWFSKSSDPVTPLPVTWLSFEARLLTGCSVQLDWSTATEENSQYFAVERSLDGRSWTEAGRVKAAGQSTTTRSYRFNDMAAGEGLMYYRIREQDQNGSVQYSVIRFVPIHCQTQTIQVYPTLNRQGLVYVSLPAGYEQAQLRLVNLQGQLLEVRKVGEGLSRTVSMQKLPAGQYILQVIHKQQVHNFKVVYTP